MKSISRRLLEYRQTVQSVASKSVRGAVTEAYDGTPQRAARSATQRCGVLQQSAGTLLSWAGAALVFALAAPVHQASAQLMITGRLVQHLTNTPIEGATIYLLSTTGRELDRVVRTNEHGAFIMNVQEGRYRLSVRRVGFDSLNTGIIEVRPRSNVQLILQLTPLEVRIAKVDVSQRSTLERGRDGMAKREPLGKGVFLYARDIAEIAHLPTWEILGRVPGIQAVLDGSVRSTEGWGCLQFMINRQPVREYPESWLTGEETFASFYQMLPNGIDIAGIEVYRKLAEVPEELKQDAWPDDMNARGVTPPRVLGNTRKVENIPLACGLIVVWTRGAW